MMNRVAIQRVGIFSAFKFGCLLGALLNVLPGIGIALVSKWIVSTLRALLESWQSVELGILGQTLHLNLIPILKLDGALKFLQDWDSPSWLVVIGIVLAISLVGGAIVAAVSCLIAAIYNLAAGLSGGIEIEMAQDERNASPVVALTPSAVEKRAWLTGDTRNVPAGGWLLQSNLIRIGRDASNQLVLSSLSVAPVHAEIVRQGERWIIRDLGSPSGTFVNDRPIRENMLKDGFRVRLGDVELMFHST